jgi:GNAT superfamily N-acetyltransferase
VTLLIRAATEEDLVWVHCSWLASYRDHSTHRMVQHMPGAEYTRRWRTLVHALGTNASVLVAVHSREPETVLGWACIEKSPNRIHYVHVRREAQRRGIARELLESAGMLPYDGQPLWYSHRTAVLEELKMPTAWEFKPWLVIGV